MKENKQTYKQTTIVNIYAAAWRSLKYFYNDGTFVLFFFG